MITEEQLKANCFSNLDDEGNELDLWFSEDYNLSIEPLDSGSYHIVLYRDIIDQDNQWAMEPVIEINHDRRLTMSELIGFIDFLNGSDHF